MATAELTTAQLRVMSHPSRLAFLRRLRADGPATARALGREFDMDSGAASYHLRRLAAGGLIEEATDLGTRRERWWQAVDRISQFDPSHHLDDENLSREYVRAVVLSKADEMQRLASAITDVSPDWLASAMFFDQELALTAQDLVRLRHDMVALLASYRQRAVIDAEGESLSVIAHVQVYRAP